MSAVNPTLELVVADDRQFSSACLANFLKEAGISEGLHVVEMDPSDPISIARNPRWRICILSVGREFSGDRWRILVKLLRESEEGRAVVIMADSDESESVRSAFQAGARGYILTTLEPKVAVSALRFIAEGGTYFPLSAIRDPDPGPDEVTAILPGNAPSEKPVEPDCRNIRTLEARSDSAPKSIAPPPSEDLLADGDDDALTPRQNAVLKHLCDARSNKEIARRLNTTEATVKVHVRQVMRKLGAKNRTEAALIALRSESGASIPLPMMRVGKPAQPPDLKPGSGDPRGLPCGHTPFMASLTLKTNHAHQHSLFNAK